jgi:hypothetical protein
MTGCVGRRCHRCGGPRVAPLGGARLACQRCRAERLDTAGVPCVVPPAAVATDPTTGRRGPVCAEHLPLCVAAEFAAEAA